MRSRAYRERALTNGRPLPSAVDRAIATALGEVWRRKIAEHVGADPDQQKHASGEPVSAHRVAERAVEILLEAQERKQRTVDKEVVGKAVMARLNPRLPSAFFRARKAGLEPEVV
ncbi:MAG TPA: hypothetical protein PKE13_19330 [Hyphomicrobium zavarzinii]|nr:hypothetical protein [Hyphomicrobium zavarzinii]